MDHEFLVVLSCVDGHPESGKIRRSMRRHRAPLRQEEQMVSCLGRLPKCNRDLVRSHSFGRTSRNCFRGKGRVTRPYTGKS